AEETSSKVKVGTGGGTTGVSSKEKERIAEVTTEGTTGVSSKEKEAVATIAPAAGVVATAGAAAAVAAASSDSSLLSLDGFGSLSRLSVDDARKLAGPALASRTNRGKTYAGITLAELLRKGGVETDGMAARRVLAPAVVLVSASDGYSAVFSVEEALLEPGFLLAFDVDGKSIAPPKGPFQLVDPKSPTRSVWGVISLELKFLGQNPREESSR